MPPGLEFCRLHLGLVTFTGALFGDRQLPRLRVDEATGLGARGDADQTIVARPGGEGEGAQRGRLGGKTLTLTGELEAETPAQLAAERARVVAALSGVEPLECVLEPRADIDPGQYTLRCSPSALSIPDRQDHGPSAVRPWRRTFTCALRLHDPRLIESSEQHVDGPAGPLELGVGGDVGTDPVIELVGPIDGLRLTSVTQDLQVMLPGVQAEAGRLVRLDFAGRHVFAETPAEPPPVPPPPAPPAPPLLVPVDLPFRPDEAPAPDPGPGPAPVLVPDPVLSDWWDADRWGLVPGVNELLAEDLATGQPLAMSVTFHPAHRS